MPFVSQSMSGLMVAKGTGVQLTGQKFNPLVSATSSAISQYLPQVGTVNSTNIVLGPGAGTYIGRIVGVVPSTMSGLMVAKAAAAGLTGRNIKDLFDSVSFGACQTIMSTGLSQGTVVGGGPGAGQGKIVGLVPANLQVLIMAQMAGKQIMGTKTMSLVSAIAFGVCNHVMSNATVITTCIGAAAGPPAGPVSIPAAPGPGRLM